MSEPVISQPVMNAAAAPAPLVLGLRPAKGPAWIDTRPGVRLCLRPADSVMLSAGRRALGAAPAGAHPADREALFLAGCVFWGLTAWEGVGVPDPAVEAVEGEPTPLIPAPITLDTVTRLLTGEPDIYDQLDRDYLMPILVRESEKNASSPSPTGTSAREGRNIVQAPVGADAASAQTPKAADTTRPRPSRKRAKGSGKS